MNKGRLVTCMLALLVIMHHLCSREGTAIPIAFIDCLRWLILLSLLLVGVAAFVGRPCLFVR